MIEHLAWHEGLFMLKECRRILKKGGILRISTPDLGVLINLYSNNNSELLEMSMKMAGFDNIVKCSYGESSDINLKGIECHGKSSGDEDIVLFETLVMEGK